MLVVRSFYTKPSLDMSIKRLARELHDLKRDPTLSHMCSAEPVDDKDLFTWQAALIGALPASMQFEISSSVYRSFGYTV